ncbi:hypothetical protein [Natronorarus salvus]|uniref:hypothetical protein n=1 Tax=Natronorarus salvus TaxID=3117733 RepID=UPI002F265A7E
MARDSPSNLEAESPDLRTEAEADRGPGFEGNQHQESDNSQRAFPALTDVRFQDGVNAFPILSDSFGEHGHELGTASAIADVLEKEQEELLGSVRNVFGVDTGGVTALGVSSEELEAVLDESHLSPAIEREAMIGNAVADLPTERDSLEIERIEQQNEVLQKLEQQESVTSSQAKLVSKLERQNELLERVDESVKSQSTNQWAEHSRAIGPGLVATSAPIYLATSNRLFAITVFAVGAILIGFATYNVLVERQ